MWESGKGGLQVIFRCLTMHNMGLALHSIETGFDNCNVNIRELNVVAIWELTYLTASCPVSNDSVLHSKLTAAAAML